MTNNFSDQEKHNIKQYERMQDLLTSYAQLLIKSCLIICGGALVSIGAAFVSFLSLENIDSKNAILLKQTLAESFESFSTCILLLLSLLVLAYIARDSFLIHSDIYGEKESVRKRHFYYGHITEGIAFFLFIYIFYKIYMAFRLIGDAFYSF